MATAVAPIAQDVYVRLLQQAIAAVDPVSDVSFRHHGIGVLQAYLTDHERVHLWHASLALPGMRMSGGMHDHRFAMTSQVLVGTLHHDELTLTADPEGTWQLYEVVHAKIAERAGYPEPTMVPGRFHYRTSRHPMTIGPRCAYTFDKRLFHESWVDGVGDGGLGDVVVTVVHKQAQENRPARLLCPRDVAPVHAFGDRSPQYERVAWAVRAMAHQRLQEALAAAVGAAP